MARRAQFANEPVGRAESRWNLSGHEKKKKKMKIISRRRVRRTKEVDVLFSDERVSYNTLTRLHVKTARGNKKRRACTTSLLRLGASVVYINQRIWRGASE